MTTFLDLFDAGGLPLLALLLLFALLIVSGLEGVQSVRFSRQLDRVTGNRVRAVALAGGSIRAAEPNKIETIISKVLPSLASAQSRLYRAGIKISMRAYLLLIVFVGALLSVFAPIPFVARFADPLVYVMALHLCMELLALPALRSRHKGNVVRQLPEVIDFIVRGLVVGQTIEASLRESVENLPNPIRDELSAVPRLIDFGVPMSDALVAMAAEIDLSEVDFFVAAVNAQADAGGNLTDVLSDLAELIRARLALRQKIDGLAAEGKLSAYILGAIPVGILVFLSWRQPEYVKPLFSTSWGNLGLLVAVALDSFGVFIALRISRAKV